MSNDRTAALLSSISAHENRQDGGNNPTELSQTELQAEFSKLGKEDLLQKQNMSNNTELLALLANRPHTTAYIRDVMGITQAESTSEDYPGSFPLYIPEKPRVGYDGFRLRLPDGQLQDVRKSAIKAWILEKTLGRIAGGTEGKGITLNQRSSRRQGFGGPKNAVIVKPLGVDASNPEDYIETFEKALDPATNEPITREITVSLAKTVEKTKEAGGTVQTRLRGVVKGFPVWQRKREFIDSLGTLKVTGSDAKLLRVDDAEVDQAMMEVLQMAHNENINIL